MSVDKYDKEFDRLRLEIDLLKQLVKEKEEQLHKLISDNIPFQYSDPRIEQGKQCENEHITKYRGGVTFMKNKTEQLRTEIFKELTRCDLKIYDELNDEFVEGILSGNQASDLSVIITRLAIDKFNIKEEQKHQFYEKVRHVLQEKNEDNYKKVWEYHLWIKNN